LYFTTSRKPGLKTRAFARELAKSFPLARYFSRGKRSLAAIVSEARYDGHKFVLILQERHGNPQALQGIALDEKEWRYAFEVKLKLLKSRQELSQAKHKLEGLKLAVKGKDLKKLFSLLGLESDPQSENLLKEEKGVISFYAKGKEIGPRLRAEAVSFGE
jgi:rRNA maturation protein Rpf1